MPYASEKQRRYMHANVGRKGITAATVKHYDEASRGMKLPERKRYAEALSRRKH